MASERKFVTEKIRRVLLREYIMSRVGRAGFGGLDVQRTPMGTRVTLITERPGLVIGRRGEAIKGLTRAIEDDFSFSNPQIEVQEVENPNLNAQIMAEKLASALERGWHFRRAGHSTVRRIMESGARGCQVTVAGKLTGQRHRREKFKSGHIKFCGQAKLDFMEKGFANARMKPGTIGVTVQIMHPDARLPDEIDVLPLPEPEAPPAAEPSAEAEKEAAEKVEEERAGEAVEELKKATDAEEKEKKKSAPKEKKKEGAEAKEKKPRKRKKKDEGEAKPEEKPEAPAKGAPKEADAENELPPPKDEAQPEPPKPEDAEPTTEDEPPPPETETEPTAKSGDGVGGKPEAKAKETKADGAEKEG
ncbi:MAG: 30S ribosomal protein S3 [Methanobacteriota archaeon]|nr:MAG: 30S ribosomal protein S3 [Euryarchaeota archaeon]